MPGRQAIKRLARTGLHSMGGLRAILWWTRDNFRILTYHRFSAHLYPDTRQQLDSQCEFLARHFRLTSMSEIARMLAARQPLPPGTLAVTIDDGYRDILTDAFPIFQKWSVPATVYLISDFLDGKLWPWWDQVSLAVMQTPLASAEIALAGQTETVRLAERREKEQALNNILDRLKRIPNGERVDFIANLGDTFEVNIPRDPPFESAPLHWSEVRKLAQAGIEFGVHTKTHPILPNLEDPQALHEEIAYSKARIEQELQRPALHFCYPNGDFDEASEGEVARCGFATAVTTEAGVNRGGAQPYRLKRLSVEPGLPSLYFREQVAGMHAG